MIYKSFYICLLLQQLKAFIQNLLLRLLFQSLSDFKKFTMAGIFKFLKGLFNKIILIKCQFQLKLLDFASVLLKTFQCTEGDEFWFQKQSCQDLVKYFSFYNFGVFRPPHINLSVQCWVFELNKVVSKAPH